MTAFGRDSVSPRASRLCPECGEALVAGRCPECSPSLPARSYDERVAQPSGLGAIDARRARSEWVTGPEERDPNTRRAHPTMVRAALAEAEVRARDSLARKVVAMVPAVVERRRRTTAPRVRVVTPIGGVIEAEPTVAVSAAVEIESVTVAVEAQVAAEAQVDAAVAAEAQVDAAVAAEANGDAVVARAEVVADARAEVVAGGAPVAAIEPVVFWVAPVRTRARAMPSPAASPSSGALVGPTNEGEEEVEGGNQIRHALRARWVWIGLGVAAALAAALALS
jgi:hypothetical protein